MLSLNEQRVLFTGKICLCLSLLIPGCRIMGQSEGRLRILVVRQVERSTLCKRSGPYIMEHVHVRYEICSLVTTLWNKTAPKPRSHSFPPKRPTPRAPNTSLRDTSSQLQSPAPSRPSYRTSTHAFTAARSLSLSLNCFISPSLALILAAFYSAHCIWKYTRERKKKRRKSKASSSASSSLPASIWPGIAMVAWPQKQPVRSTALEKREREREREGNERQGEKAGEIGCLMLKLN